MTEKDITLCGHGSGKPTTKNMFAYLENRYNQKAYNGKRKGLVCIRRRRGMEDPAKQLGFHNEYSKLIGRNIYSQNLRAYVYAPYIDGHYYSDCSSSGCATYGRLDLYTGLLNTAGIYSSNLFETVPVQINNGHVVNVDDLRIGDALLFVGNDPNRPQQIGHVEFIYELKEAEVMRWVQDGDDWYYQDQYGHNTYGWKEIKETAGESKHWYYFDTKGKMLTDWQQIDGRWCYFQPTGPLKGAMWHEADDRKGFLELWYT